MADKSHNQQQDDAAIIQAASDFIREESKRDLYFFSKVVLRYDWLTPHIHLPLCRMLEEYKTNHRMKVTLPRGWLKSTVCSIAYAIWRAIRDPNERILLVQNTHDNAVAKLGAIKSQWEENHLLRSLFPELLPKSKSKWKAESLCLARSKSFPESTFECGGIRTDFVGRHYTLIIEDDTVAPDKDEMGEENIAPVKEDIGQAIGFHKLCVPLLVDPKDTILVVGTRWFEKDLLSYIDEKEGKVYKCYSRAAKEDENGKPDEAGRIVYPERFDESVLEGLRLSMGPYMYACLYMNNPTRSDDMLFKQEWFTYFDSVPRDADVAYYTTVDPSGDEKTNKGKKADYNVVITCGRCRKTGRVWVVLATRGKWNPGQLIDAIFEHVKMFNSLCVGVESNSYQASLQFWIKERQAKEGIYFRVEPLHSKHNKAQRIMGLQPLVYSGKLKFHPSQAWLMNELMVFPLGANDDGADALANQLALWAVSGDDEAQDDMGDDVDPVIREAMSSILARERKFENSIYDVIAEKPRY